MQPLHQNQQVQTISLRSLVFHIEDKCEAVNSWISCQDAKVYVSGLIARFGLLSSLQYIYVKVSACTGGLLDFNKDFMDGKADWCTRRE